MRLFAVRVYLILLLFIVSFNEYLIYILKALLAWPPISCDSSNPCSKILLVADPQILGELKENLFTRFDCDKFLRNTFSLAYDYVKPDGILFLGDLVDEGSQASDEQFERYYDRFRSIFNLEKLYSSNVPVLFIAGDNDIGGEDYEVIKRKTVERFFKYFGNEDTAVIRGIRVFRVNRLLHTYSRADNASSDSNLTLNIAISHLSLTDHASAFTAQVTKDVKPDFILSAHEHKSYAVLTLREDGELLYYEQLKYNFFKHGLPTWTFQTASSTNFSVITEITVPTCSYRMGENDVGFGVLIQDMSEPTKITYHVLWSPSRFIGLQLYVGMLILTLLIMCLNWTSIQRQCKFRRRYIHL